MEDPKVAERFRSPFAPLSLSSVASEELQQLAEAFVVANIRAFEQHAFDHNGEVDETQWKPMYSQDGVRSFAERSAGSGGSFRRPRGYSSAPPPGQEDLPVVLVTGTIAGALDDTVYGLICPTIDLMRIKTSYVKDTLVRGCVLATILKPSVDDPYRSLTVKWMEKGQRAHIRAVISNRDFVYMESTGVEYLRNGERVGFHLVHSVQFPETPSRDSAIRGNMSICAVYREKEPNVTEVFLKGFLNPAGGLVRSIITRSAAKALVSIAKNVECAYMKKLMWAVRYRRHHALTKTSVEASSSRCETEEDMDAESLQLSRVATSVNAPCPSCEKTPSRITRFRAFATGHTTTKRKRCKLCHQPVCSNCRIAKKLSFLLPDRRLVQLACVFCASCVQQVIDIKAVDVARDEITLDSDFFQWQDTYTGSSGSNSGSGGPSYLFLDDLN